MTEAETGRGRILIVEDDVEIADFIARGLRNEGFEIDIATEAKEIDALLENAGYRIIVLDRMLPDAEGVDLCRKLRNAGDATMILMLTAKDALSDKIDGLRAGADDYLTKPFAFAEFLARLEALLRRAPETSDLKEISIADLRLDLIQKRAYRAGHDLGLTATEFKLLHCLSKRAGAVVSRTDILRDVWGYDFDTHTNIVEVYVAYLRRKIDQDADHKLIRNHRGFGYWIERRACE